MLRGDGLGADPPVAVPLGPTVAQPHPVHHARAQEPVVVGVVQAQRVRPVAQVTAVQPGGHLTGDRQIERRDLLLYRGEGPCQETAVSRRGHDPSRLAADPVRSPCSEHGTVPAAEKDAADECALRLGRTMSVPPDDMKLGVRGHIRPPGPDLIQDITPGKQPWLYRVRCRRSPGPARRCPRRRRSARTSRSEAVLAGTKPTEPAHDDSDHRPDTQLAGPRHAAPLPGKGRYEPVQPECCPSDGNDELYHTRHDSDCHPAWAVRDEKLRFGIGRGCVESRAETAAVVAPRSGLVVKDPRSRTSPTAR